MHVGCHWEAALAAGVGMKSRRHKYCLCREKMMLEVHNETLEEVTFFGLGLFMRVARWRASLGRAIGHRGPNPGTGALPPKVGVSRGGSCGQGLFGCWQASLSGRFSWREVSESWREYTVTFRLAKEARGNCTAGQAMAIVGTAGDV